MFSFQLHVSKHIVVICPHNATSFCLHGSMSTNVHACVITSLPSSRIFALSCKQLSSIYVCICKLSSYLCIFAYLYIFYLCVMFTCIRHHVFMSSFVSMSSCLQVSYLHSHHVNTTSLLRVIMTTSDRLHIISTRFRFYSSLCLYNHRV